MKFTKNILMILGLLLQVGVSFANDWESSGPTREDILASKRHTALDEELERRDRKVRLGFELISAVKGGDLKKVEALISDGANLDLRDGANFTAGYCNTMTALMIAAKKGYTDIVSRLISAGANLEATDDTCMTALMIAAKEGYIDIVSRLISAGAIHKKNLRNV